MMTQIACILGALMCMQFPCKEAGQVAPIPTPLTRSTRDACSDYQVTILFLQGGVDKNYDYNDLHSPFVMSVRSYLRSCTLQCVR